MVALRCLNNTGGAGSIPATAHKFTTMKQKKHTANVATSRNKSKPVETSRCYTMKKFPISKPLPIILTPGLGLGMGM